MKDVTILAIVGDFSGYTSKALQDFITECNKGRQIFFVADVDQAVNRLAQASLSDGINFMRFFTASLKAERFFVDENCSKNCYIIVASVPS